jgi:amino acid adenylation domain-containing protein/thioester reductase-like protein
MIGAARDSDTVHGCFSAAAESFPQRPALITDDQVLTYADLRRWMLAVAAALPEVRPDDVVGLCAGRSPAMVAGMLGILRAGGAYLPLDPGLPDLRLRMLIEDSATRVVLVDAARAPRLRELAPEGVRVLVVPDEPTGAVEPTSRPVTGSQLAYVIYTSGSTGEPKGVLIEHHSAVAMAHDPFTAVRPDDVFCQLAPVQADPSAFEIWTPLLNGASLVLPPEGELTVHEIGEQLVRHEVTVLRLVAPLFTLVVDTNVDALRGLRMIISGGDRASEQAVRKALAELPGCTVVNAYGPTEATVLAFVHPMTAYDDLWPSVPIGRPLAGVTAHIVDEHGGPADEGELRLGGPHLGRGYLGRPDLTADRFVETAGERVYRTGDRVRRLPDGTVEFLGRLDGQVKIRGFRVEPGETETVLAGHPAVAEAAVVARHDHLEAFVRLRVATGTGELRGYLAERLPDHLVPTTIEQVAAFPRLGNGKLDRRALAARHTGRPLRAPASETEQQVALIWAEALGLRAGLDDSFLDLGGHSLAAMGVVAKVAHRFGVQLPLTAVFKAATLADFAAAIDRAAPSPVSLPTGRDRAPLSAGQQGVWFDDQLADESNFTIARTFGLRGPVDPQALQAAISMLADRQPALRTIVESTTDGLWQVVQDNGPELRHLHVGTDDQARELVARATREPFGGNEPLVRVLLISLEANRSVLHITLHHVIADDWSLDILFDELSACYEAAVAGTEPGLPPLDVRYTDVVPPDNGDVSALAQRLHDYPGTIELPTDHPAPEVLSGRGDQVRFDLDAELTAALTALARDHRMSRFMLTMTAVYLLLAKHTQQRDICVGTPVAGRDRPGTAGLIGYFLAMLPVRVRPGDRHTVPELLAHVRETCLETYQHTDVPLPALARALGLHTARGRFPLFQVVLAYQQRPPRVPALPGVAVTPWDVPGATAKFDLGFSFEEHGGTTGGVIEYSTDLFDRQSIERMAGHLVNVFRWLAAHPDGDLRDLRLLSPAEERLVRLEWNRTEADFPRDRCLHELISEQAGRRGDKVAVVGPDESLTYAQLEERSDRLAGRLIQAGVRVEDRVAICVERSARLMVAILGVLKAGGAYVPLDPAYPAERLRFIEADARADVLITTGELRRNGAGARAGTIIDIDIDIDEPVPDQVVLLKGRSHPGNLAYLIYTSGSAGRPKGAAIEHRAAVNMLYGHMAWYSFDETDVWSQFAACGFDMAVYEQFMPLLTGATSVIATEQERMDGRLFVEFVDRNRITVQVSSPAFLRSLGQPELPTVRALITGGEVANLPDVAYYAPRKTFVNCYGPTEVTICTTSYQATGTETTPRLPIGRPQPNTRLYIVDSDGQLCPIGVPGEIYIGGLGLARGYWDDPELTAQRFTTLPALGDERLYRTGDRARWLPDGTVDFLGRLDTYVKLRGYRVEPGEIEAVLIAHPAVAQAAVLVRDESLVAFVVGDASAAHLRGYLAARLPYYMVPAAFVPLSRMPMTEHVKIDRRALAALLDDTGPARPAEDVATSTDTLVEARLAKLWAELLAVPAVDADTDFFALGGHSLVIARLLDQVETEFGSRIGVRDFLAAPTVRGLAARIDGRVPADDSVSAADARLEPSLSFPAVTTPATRPGAVLLTGATGFVGAFLLRELLARTSGEVFCLVRAPGSAQAAGRVRQAIESWRLGVDPGDPRIVAVPGDLAATGLGLDERTHQRLADTVDAVFHAGAEVNHLSSYARLKAANVDGTAELVRLAATGRPKRFHQISSLSVFTGDAGRTITEDTLADRERHSAGQGYSASKWVADRMVRLAIDRGLTGHVYRIGRMSGDRVHGVASVDDMFYRLLLSCAAVRGYPEDALLHTNLLPVDVAAGAIVALALNGGQDNGQAAYHVHHRATVTLAEFMAVHDRIHDTKCRPVPLGEWLTLVRTAPGELPIRPYEPALLELARTAGERAPVKYSNEVTLRQLAACGVHIPDITDKLIERYWRFLAEGGHLG